MLGQENPKALRRLQLRFAKHLGRLLFSLPLDVIPGEARASGQAVRRAFEVLVAGDKGLAFRLLLRPQVHVHLWCATFAIEQGRQADAAMHSRRLWDQLQFEMHHEGVDGVSSASVEGPSVSPSLCLPSPSFRRLAPRLALALTDTNPLALDEAHPDKSGNALSLGDASPEDWVASLSGALEVVGTWLPAIRQEMSLVLHQFVPVGTDDVRHLSASFAESVGTVYLTLHPMKMTMAEAVIHEFQHNKLNMLFALDRVMHNAYFPLYASPVRPDPRPLAGVLLAAHAFVPVAEMYARMAEAGAMNPDSARRFRTVVESNSEALATLSAHADPTEAGKTVLSELNACNVRHTTALNLEMKREAS